MDSMSSNPSDAEAIRRLLAESGVADTHQLGDALLDLRLEARSGAPDPSPELEAFFTPGVTPLRKSSRRRGYLLGGAIIAAMAAGTTGVAATNGGLWITAEDSHEAPAPVEYEQVPAPEPVPVPAETDPASVPQLPVEPVETAPAPAETPLPVEPSPDDPGHGTGKLAESGRTDDAGGHRESPGQGSEPGTEGFSQEFNGQGGPGHSGGNKGQGPGNNNGYGFGRDKGQDGPGRGDAGKDNKDSKNSRDSKDSRDGNRGGPQHGHGSGRG